MRCQTVGRPLILALALFTGPLAADQPGQPAATPSEAPLPIQRLSPQARESETRPSCEEAKRQYRLAASMFQADQGLVAAQKRQMQNSCRDAH